MAWSECTETAGYEIFEGQSHHNNCRQEARFWPHFGAITTRPPAWLALQFAQNDIRSQSASTLGHNSCLIRRGKTNVRLSGPVSMGPFHYAHNHQDVLLAGHRADLPDG